MISNRRKDIRDLIRLLSDLNDDLEVYRSEAEDDVKDIPESQHDSEQNKQAMTVFYALDSAVDNVEQAINSLVEACDCGEDI